MTERAGKKCRAPHLIRWRTWPAGTRTASGRTDPRVGASPTDVLILDDFAMRQLGGPGRRSLRTGQRTTGPLFDHHGQPGAQRLVSALPNPVVAELLLYLLINTSHQVIMNGPSYRPNKRPKNPTDKPGKPSIK